VPFFSIYDFLNSSLGNSKIDRFRLIRAGKNVEILCTVVVVVMSGVVCDSYCGSDYHPHLWPDDITKWQVAARMYMYLV